MSFLELLLLLLISGICGSIAQALVGFSRGGCLLSIAVGFIGALLGSWIARKLALPDFFVLSIGGTDFPVVWSIIGAVIFVAVLSLITPRRSI
jgi:uncharacterized membrane protein YeaQ/YmgE (transglycosylase-associated protein family)